MGKGPGGQTGSWGPVSVVLVPGGFCCWSGLWGPETRGLADAVKVRRKRIGGRRDRDGDVTRIMWSRR